MVDPQQTPSSWRPMQSTPPPQAPWVSSAPTGRPSQPPRGPPVGGRPVSEDTVDEGAIGPGMRPVAPFRPGVPPPVTSPFVPRAPFRPQQAPPAAPSGSRPFQPMTASLPSSPRSAPRGPPSVGNFPSVRPPGHVQPLYRPAPVPTFAAPAPTMPRPPPPGTPQQMPLAAPPPLVHAQSRVSEVLDQFESLTLGPSAPGVHDDVDTAASLPRPSGIIPGPPFPSYPQNAHHSFLRMTTIYAPRSGSLRERFQFPYGALVQPLAETAESPEVPLVKLGTYGILRCRRCRTYVNPFVAWIDGGRRWKCNICGGLNDTPREYYCTVNDDGTRRDVQDRPELSCGSVEYVAPPEYMVCP